MTRVLITGGAGFIGRHTTRALLEKGYSVRVVDSLDPQIHGDAPEPFSIGSNVEFVRGDVRCREDVTRSLQDVDAVYHFAALTGVGQSMYAIEPYSDVNINGTAMLLDVLANGRHRVQKIILASSRAIYGEGACRCPACGLVNPPARSREHLESGRWEVACPACAVPVLPVPTPETKPAAPISVYALTKLVQEEMVRMFSATYGIPSTILRYFNVYGAGQALNNPYTGIGAIFTNRALAGREIPLYEDGNAGRDFVNVHDVVQANILALENVLANNQTFNIGSGERVTVRGLAEKIVATLRATVPLTLTGQYRAGDIRDCYADLTLSSSVLGYRPSISLSAGIQELVSWARCESVEDRHDAAEEALRQRNLI